MKTLLILSLLAPNLAVAKSFDCFRENSPTPLFHIDENVPKPGFATVGSLPTQKQVLEMKHHAGAGPRGKAATQIEYFHYYYSIYIDAVPIGPNRYAARISREQTGTEKLFCKETKTRR